ncbi:MAG: sugar ABC transporter permease [Spirochaetales bacterium]|nr:sugar ABC transporter permease [Spirochaetales bacterium]
MLNRWDRKKYEAAGYLLPGLLFLFVIFIIPLGYAVGITFFRWTLIRPDLGIRFVGLKNYITILSDPFTWQTLGRTLLFVMAAVFLEMVLGTAVSLVLNLGYRGHNLVQSVFLIPFMMAPIVVGFAWRFLLNNSFGPVPELFRSIGLGSVVDTPLLANPKTVLFVLILVDLWQFTPFVVLVTLAGMKSLPAEPFEAAVVDGATAWQRFWRITVPLLRPSILVAVVIRTLTAFRIFDTVSIMTGGGPGSSSEVLSYFGYRMAFQSYEMGLAGTIGVLTMAVSLIFTIFYIRQVGVE